MKDIQVLLVVETNSLVRSDDAYYSWILKNFFTKYISSSGQDGLRIRYKFIYMDGKTNYNSPSVKHDILIAINEFQSIGTTQVVYCFDIDNKTKKNTNFISTIEGYCLTNNYYLSIAYREIEDVLNVPEGGSKHDRVILFGQHHPKKSAFDKGRFFTEYQDVTKKQGQTNFGLVINSIIGRE